MNFFYKESKSKKKKYFFIFYFLFFFFWGWGGGGGGVDVRTDKQAQSNFPLNFFEIGGITMHTVNVQVMVLTSSIYDHFSI